MVACNRRSLASSTRQAGHSAPVAARLSQRTSRSSSRRGAFSLMELILALGLSVLAMAIIVQLVQMYSSNFATRGEDIRRGALARSLLSMIADDLRSTVSQQEFDTSVLQQMLMGQSGGGAGGSGGSGAAGAGPGGSAASGGAGDGGAGGSGAAAGGTGGSGAAGQGAASGAGGAGGGGAAGGAAGAGAAGTAGGASTTGEDGEPVAAGSTLIGSALPLGIYGSIGELTIDVSRLPRPDEYIAQQTSLMSGVLTDVPGDIKSVTYYVQAPTNMGVSDRMNEVTTTTDGSGLVGGLVRRQIDRAVLSNAEELGQTDQLLRTGDLIAPEVVSLEFAYFDGIEWLTDWDSSTQGQPWLIEISLAMQSKTGERQGVVSPGVSLSVMPAEELSQYGIEIYTLTVAIPGAQMQSASPGSADAAAGLESVGL